MEARLSAVLRACGPDFDVDAFAADSAWSLGVTYRKGDRRRPASARPGGEVRDRSGFNMTVSEAGFDDLAAQVSDAVAFLRQHESEVVRLTRFPGVSDVAIDFGISGRDVAVQTDTFPAELVGLAGRCGIALTLSRYPADADQP
jgi:hypothetical protein